MPKGRPRLQHFDVPTLIQAVQDQPIGLEVNTSHPDRFKRIMYLFYKEHPGHPRVRLLQSPASAHNFYLVPEQTEVEQPA